MQLDDYLRVLVKRWYVPVLLLLMAVAGAYLYTYVSGTRTAEGRLAVPLAQFTAYDNVVNGRALAERVAAKLDDGTTPEEVDGMMAGGFDATGSRLLPAYKVGATDSDAERAVQVANIALDESMVLFKEVQAAQLEYIQVTYQAERDKAEEEALAAHEAFDRFLADNNAYSLPTRIAQQAQIVSELRIGAGLEAGTTNTNGVSEGDLGAAQAELDRLLALEPEYNSLSLEVTLQENEISSLEAQLRSLALGGSGYDQARAAVEAELETARTALTDAQTALSTFESGNGVSDLPSMIRAQQQTVNDLLYASAIDGDTTVAESLSQAQAALGQLTALQPEYNRLAREVEEAESKVDIREQQNNFVIQSSLPTENQVEVINRAELKSIFWWTAIRYAVAVFVAAFVSLLLVYVLCFFEKTPPTIEDLEKALGKPVIGRVPRSV